MKTRDLKRFIEDLDGLPSLPPIAIKLIQMTTDKKSRFQDISRIIESDQSLCSRILRIANSAAFGLARQVSTVERAISLLGMDLVRSMALSIIVVDLFNTEKEHPFDQLGYWQHNLSCAITSEMLAQRLAYPRPQEAFIAGLLHDLGKMLFFQWNSEQYGEVIAEARSSRISLLELEEVRFGMGHNRLGKILMEHWNFPPFLPDTTWLHHQPLSHFGASPKEELPFIVKCANSLCHIERFGESGNRVGDLSAEELERAVGLSPEELAQIAAEVLQRMEEISEYFDWDGCTPTLYLSAVAQANKELAEMQVDLITKNRQIEKQQSLLDTICRMQEAVPAGLSQGRALEKILELLSEAIPCRRLMGFLINEREGIIEGQFIHENKNNSESFTLPLETDSDLDYRQIHPREQFSLIEQAVLSLGEGLAVAARILESLRSSNLMVLPLETQGLVLGQILIEPEPSDQAPESVQDLLRQFARSAVLALERVLLFEAVEQQADDIARMARKGQETQTRLYQVERLASVGRLAAGAAHEINNPLAAISAQAQLLLRRIKDEKDCKSLQAIIDQTGRISKIISDLMGFARPAEPRIEPTLIKTVLDHTLSVVENRIKIAGTEIRKEYEPDLPLIYADSKQLEQVFLNLTINALQAMQKGGRLTIRLAMDSNQDCLRIEFSDTGDGIPPENLASIFDPFYTTKKEGEGTGLGLAICHSIIESHKGEIKVASKPGEGTTFIILLPLGGMSEVRKIQSELTRKLKPVPSEKRRKAESVLIIDDEESLRTVMLESLLEEGYEVDIASDGAQGLDKLNQNQYDVTLLDLRMPKVDGMEVLATVRRTSPQMPVIVISGLAHEREFKAAEKAGAYACIKKPFDIGELLGTVQRALKFAKGRSSIIKNQIA